jgi:hypothetical protein
MRFVLICLAAVLLSGCGYIAGNKVEFESDLSHSRQVKIRELAGKTFYIKNENDYQRLVQLKKELNELKVFSYKLTPSRVEETLESEIKIEECEWKILAITDNYDGFKTTKWYDRSVPGIIGIFLIILARAVWPKNRFLNPPAEQEKKENKILGIIVGGLILTLLFIYLLLRYA